MVGINLAILDDYTERTSEIMMKKACSAQALQLNNQFKLVEQSVKNIYDISERIRPPFEELQSLEVTNQYINQFQKMAITIANNTEGALAVYYRINPDIHANGSQGFFYVKSKETGVFEAEKITDLLKYDVNDIEHVGWYYIPVWKGQPVWMDPYYNANIGIQMISYVVPIYDGIKLVGVVGMDVDFNRLLEITENIDIYPTSGAVLCSMANSLIYYNKCDAFGNSIPSEIYHILQGSNSSDKMIAFNNGKKKYAIHYETLDDHMKILVYAEISDINKQALIAIIIGGITFAVAFILDLLLSMRISKRITKPIINITEAAKAYAQGKWNTKVSCDTNDELKVLTDNITIMAEKTNEYIEYIHNMARKDGLTGLRNKTDYMMYVETINKQNEKENKDYAVVVFDLNNLKYVNDNFGHEAGDELLLAASKYICKIFSHSPIFRIGGDEFVAIIDSGDFENRNQLLEEFKNYMRLSNNSDSWRDFCIACGMASNEHENKNYEEVFKQADKNMYENKKELKNDLKPR